MSGCQMPTEKVPIVVSALVNMNPRCSVCEPERQLLVWQAPSYQHSCLLLQPALEMEWK